jgi:4-oxalomesaconate tautomerase
MAIHMTQTGIPFLFMRGGSSRGPYFRRNDLPYDLEALSQVLIEVVGAGHPNNIDGLGGGTAVTTKVAMLSASKEEGVDIDYFFGQVGVDAREVDYGPTCGNILVGVGPAAIEMGLVPATGDVTTLTIRAVNTGALVETVVQTPGGQVTYEGTTEISGVLGTAAPVGVSFLGVVGTSCGAMLPTGNLRDTIDGVDVTCMDVAIPMMIARADAFGLTGYETTEELDASTDLFARMETIRLKAGEKMGLGDVTRSVMPKIGLLAKPRNGGTFTARYFMPWKTHPTMAVTGSQCLAACALTPGTVADGLADVPAGTPALITVEHPQGAIEVTVDYTNNSDDTVIKSAGLVRSARLIAKGEVMVSSALHSASNVR